MEGHELNHAMQSVYALGQDHAALGPALQSINALLGYDKVKTLDLRGVYNKYIVDELLVNVYGATRLVVFSAESIQHFITSASSSTTRPNSRPSTSRFPNLLHRIESAKHQYAPISEYGPILNSIYDLVHSFADISARCDQELMRFLNKCFNNELRQLPNLLLHFEDLDIFLDENHIKELAVCVENVLGQQISRSSLEEVTDHSLYQGFHNKLGFECTDPNFRCLFYLFLQISSYRFNPTPTDQDFTRIISFMLTVYERTCGVDWMEIADYGTLERKLNLINDFFVSYRGNEGDKLLEEFYFPEMTARNGTARNGTNGTIPVEPATSHSNGLNTSQSDVPGDLNGGDLNGSVLPKIEESQLLSNVERLIPQLNDFHFDFDPIFSPSLKLFITNLNSQNEIVQADDLNYLNRLISLINDIVEYENDDASNNGGDIYQTALLLYEHHKLLSPTFLAQLTESTLLMRYCSNLASRCQTQKRGILKKWNLHILRLSQLEYTFETSWKPYTAKSLTETVFSLWYRHWSRLIRMDMAAASYYNKSTQVKIFLSKFVSRLRQLQAQEQKSDRYRLQRLVNRWKRKASIHNDQYMVAQKHYDKTAVSSTYHLWKYKSDMLSVLASRSLEVSADFENNRNKLLLQSYFASWYDRMNSPLDGSNSMVYLTDKLRKLDMNADGFQLKKYFKKLKLELQLAQNSAKVHDLHDDILVTFFFNKWSAMYKLKQLSLAFEGERNRQIKDNALTHWSHITKLNAAAVNFNTKRQLKNGMREWKLQFIAKGARSQGQSGSMRPGTKEPMISLELAPNAHLKLYFKKWLLSHKSRNLTQTHSKHLQALFFEHWKRSQAKNREMNQLSEKLQDRIISQRYLRTWNNMTNFQHSLLHVSDVHHLSKFWAKLQGKMEVYNGEFEQKTIDFHSKYPIRARYSLADETLLRGTIHMWQQKYERQFQQAAHWKVSHFQDEIVANNRKARYLVDWVLKYNSVKTKNVELSMKCDEFLAKSSIKRTIFQTWSKKAHRVSNINHLSLEFQEKLLRKKYLFIWYDKYLDKAQHLNEICQELIDQKDLRRQRDILSEWSMKYIKFITRNQQSCDLFIKRWEASRMRSIFDLWIYKTQASSPDSKSNVFLDTSSESFIENESPLALRNRPPSKPTMSDQVELSYLNSPIKTNTLPPDTPQENTNISPSRIQTSIRMKNEKIQALREHYGRVRLVSRPRKLIKDTNPPQISSQTSSQTSHTNPNPPRPYSFLSTRLSPPKRPDFSSTPKKVAARPGISPRTSRYSAQNSTTDTTAWEDEFDLKPPVQTVMTQDEIANAKRLRRITPIFIPESEEDPEPKLSPVLTVRKKNSVS